MRNACGASGWGPTMVDEEEGRTGACFHYVKKGGYSIYQAQLTAVERGPEEPEEEGADHGKRVAGL